VKIGCQAPTASLFWYPVMGLAPPPLESPPADLLVVRHAPDVTVGIGDGAPAAPTSAVGRASTLNDTTWLAVDIRHLRVASPLRRLRTVPAMRPKTLFRAALT
jgi:hypothetical protein